MYLAKFLDSLIKKNGFVLIDANKNKYNIGNPKKENPITLKLLDKKLHYKLLLFPDLFFGEAYTNGSIIIENGSITDFLELAFKNIGRGEITKSAYLIKKILQFWRFVSNYNFPLKSKKDIQHQRSSS